MLQFTHGVEIGAHLAYVGHYKRTNDSRVGSILEDELEHQLIIKSILKHHGRKTIFMIDLLFYMVGKMVGYMCRFSPIFMLNKIAMLLELFAVVSYKQLAKEFPLYVNTFLEMEETEQEHADYFSRN